MNPRDLAGRGDHIKKIVESEGISDEFKERVIDATIAALTEKIVIKDVVSLF
jgi:hypothetical protein